MQESPQEGFGAHASEANARTWTTTHDGKSARPAAALPRFAHRGAISAGERTRRGPTQFASEVSPDVRLLLSPMRAAKEQRTKHHSDAERRADRTECIGMHEGFCTLASRLPLVLHASSDALGDIRRFFRPIP